jgi:hypothetical protein
VINANIQFELHEKENELQEKEEELKRLRSLLLNKNKTTMTAAPPTPTASFLFILDNGTEPNKNIYSNVLPMSSNLMKTKTTTTKSRSVLAE